MAIRRAQWDAHLRKFGIKSQKFLDEVWAARPSNFDTTQEWNEDAQKRAELASKLMLGFHPEVGREDEPLPNAS